MSEYSLTRKETPHYLHALGIGIVALLLVFALAAPQAVQLFAKTVSQFLMLGSIPHQLGNSNSNPLITVFTIDYSELKYEFRFEDETTGFLWIIVFAILFVPTMGLLKGYLWFKTSWFLLSIAIGLFWNITRLTLVISTGFFFGYNASYFVHYLLIVFDFLWMVAMWSYGVSFLKREKVEETL